MREGRQIADDRPSAVVSAMSWLREQRALSLSLALAGLAVVLVVDLFVPGYAIAAAYLLVIIFAAIALPRRTAVAMGSAGLVLTLVVMAAQGRMGAENLLLVGFGVLAGAGMFVLVSLHDSVESLYTEQRKRLEHESFTVRLVDALLPLPDPVGGGGHDDPAAGRAARGLADGLLRGRRDRPTGRAQRARAPGRAGGAGPRGARRRTRDGRRRPGARAAGPSRRS